MEILLDQKTMEIEESDVHNLEEVLLKIMSEHVRPENVVITVKLNGEVYSEKDPHDAARIPLSDIETLEIDTMTTEEIARKFFENGARQLGMMIQAAEKISELFRIADENEANKQYADFLENLRLFMKMLAEVKEMLNGTLEDRLQRLSEMMDQMIHTQEQEDWIVLADLLEYGLVPLLKEWQEILPALGDQSPA